VWLDKQPGCRAQHLYTMGLIDKADAEIFFFARENDFIVVTKDSDFLDLVALHGTPPQILFVTCGNAPNRKLIAVFEDSFTAAVAHLVQAMAVIEIG